MLPPLLSYVSFNRLGLVERNLKSLFETAEEFDMHIIDNNSADGTWEYLQSLKEPRIKSLTRLEVNRGPVYAVNLNLTKRRPGQYFITVDNDVKILTGEWIKRFMEIFETFPEVGLLGVQRADPYPEYLPPVTPHVKNGVCYLELKNAKPGEPMDFVPGCCQCLKPELIDVIGYWSEENYYGDAELSARVVNYTPFKAGFTTSIRIDMTQRIECGDCRAKEWCKRDANARTCFELRDSLYKNDNFAKSASWKYKAIFHELEENGRSAYCASVHDEKSMREHLYHRDWALENFKYYEENAN